VKEVYYHRKGVMTDMVKIGDGVAYVDEFGVERAALVTNVFSATCVNLVLVSGDESQGDSYGRQIKRETSQVHKSIQTAPGRYWFERS
jgi:hypothetical protein